MSERLDHIYGQRASVVVSLAFTWSGGDLSAPVVHTLVIATAPSLVKDALSLGLLTGNLEKKGHALEGELALTDDGRALVERWRQEVGIL